MIKRINVEWIWGSVSRYSESLKVLNKLLYCPDGSSGLIFLFIFPHFLVVSLLLNKSTGNHIFHFVIVFQDPMFMIQINWPVSYQLGLARSTSIKCVVGIYFKTSINSVGNSQIGHWICAWLVEMGFDNGNVVIMGSNIDNVLPPLTVGNSQVVHWICAVQLRMRFGA